MFLKKTPSKSGRINLAIVDGYYDKATKKQNIKLIYHELELDKFLNNRQRHSKGSYAANTIMKMLVYSRILASASKKSSFDHREMFFEKTNYSLDDVYRCLWVIYVADKGMTPGDNIWYTINTPAHDGYVFSMSIRGAEKSMKEYVLNDEGYVWLGREYKRKSHKYPRTIQVTSTSGKKIKKQVDEKQVVFWNI